MISKLKRRFIILAMVSLTVLLTVIVAGMNIINYNSVVSTADDTLQMLQSNRGRMPSFFDDDLYDEISGAIGDMLSDSDDYYNHNRGRGGRAPKGFSRDEAEETRFFTVLVDVDGKAVMIDTNRISAVDREQAAEYAEKIAAGTTEKGFIDDYRYAVGDEGYFRRITFLDCGRTLGAFREFLRASIIMSLVGLLAVFGVICYFAGRIVRPVAESYEKQKRFITDAGHEIKTPLAIIKANIDVMRMDLDDLGALQETENSELKTIAESLGDSLSDVDGQTDRLASLTNDLVYLSRMEEDGNTLTLTEIPVSDIVADTTDSFSALAQERDKELTTEIEPMLSIRGSTKEIEKLVSILVENALKYSPEGDNVRIALRRDGRNVELEVKNKTLSPISEEDLEHVFDRFYRVDKSRNSEVGGHGIGLSMANAIVSLHGGKIRARSGDGSEFIVTATIPAV